MASGDAEKGGSWRYRSAEGRKRIISEIVQTLSPHREQAPALASIPPPAALASIPFKQKPGFPPPYMVALPGLVPLLSTVSQYNSAVSAVVAFHEGEFTMQAYSALHRCSLIASL